MSNSNPPMKPINTQIDHIVVAARTLSEGIAWCEATLGITPTAGGEHPLFGTHNRIFNVSTAQYPRVFFEIIAINSEAPRAVNTPASGTNHLNKRWFDLDSSKLQAGIKSSPRLVHFVANTSDVSQACVSLIALGIDRGPAVQASRMTPTGLLEWQITVRDDGQRLFSGGLPTLVQWGAIDTASSAAVHPTDTMVSSGIALQSLHMTTPQAIELQAAYQAIHLQGVTVNAGEPNLIVTLQTPIGLVTLESKGI